MEADLAAWMAEPTKRVQVESRLCVIPISNRQHVAAKPMAFFA